MLQCFNLELASELGASLDMQPFSGSPSVYTIFFFHPP
jgi:hypothetical protein